MKRSLILSLSLSLLLLSCGQQSEKSLTEDQKNQVIAEIKPVITNILDIVYQVKLNNYLELVDSSNFINIMNGQILDYKSFKEGNKQLWSGLEYQKINVVTDSYMVIDNGTVLYTLQGNDEAKFKNGDILKVDPLAASILLKKINGIWKISFNHWSGILQMIPAQSSNPDQKK